MASHLVVAAGEVLWDSLPDGLFLGGATFNVCYHLSVLGARAVLVSAVGDDALGEEVRRRMGRFGLATDGIFVHPELPTGRVLVEIDASGQPSYDILRPVAWDEITVSAAAELIVEQAEVVVFGSLAQRSSVSRAAIRRLAAAPALGCFDVNLRPPYDDREVVEESLVAADLVHLNDEELRILSGWFGFDAASQAGGAFDERHAMEALSERFRLATVCVTRGARGARLLNAGDFFEHGGFEVSVVDTVGAGDAFLAGLLDAFFRGEAPAAWLDWACRCGAAVAAARGPTPAISRESIAALGFPLIE